MAKSHPIPIIFPKSLDEIEAVKKGIARGDIATGYAERPSLFNDPEAEMKKRNPQTLDDENDQPSST